MSSGNALAAPIGWYGVDLGTLGGPTSYANGVNDDGKVVGDSLTDSSDSHAFAWTKATGMVDLGTLGGSYASAIAVNASGMVAGTSSLDTGEQHAVRWTAAGAIQDLGTLGGGDSFATAINAGGQVVGTSTTVAGEQHAFSAMPGEPMLDLGTLGGSYSFATAVNAGGRVVGVSATLGDLEEHAFSWTPGGTMVDIGAVGSSSRPTAVNDAGQIVGSTTPSDNPELQQAFIWTDGAGMTLIGSPSSFSQANAISPSGQVVGVLPSATDVHVQHAFTRTPVGALTDIGTLGGDFGAAYAVNTTGAVVGNSTIAGDTALHAFYWTTGGLLDLGTLGGSDSFGVAVNASGQVIAFSGNANGDTHAVIWQKDTTPPVITRTVTGTLGSNGWYTSNVGVTWTATDAETAITTPACATNTVSADTAGTTFTCVATSAGGTSTQSVTIKRDATPPAVAYASHPASYPANQAIAFGCTATDATSGVASTCQGVNIAASTLAPGPYTRTTSATDNAGNTGTVSTTFTVTAVVTDSTPPVITRVVSGTLGSNGWYTGNVTVTWTRSDPESPITTPACATNTVSADTAGTTFTCVATSAGGTSTQSVTIKRDATLPAVAYASHPASYPANQAIAFGCTATDATSGVASTCQGVNIAASTLAPGPYTRTTSATDNAGNTGTVSTTFTVTAVPPPPPPATTPNAVCLLMRDYVQDSAKYRALKPLQRLIVDIVTNLGCAWVRSITPRLSASQEASLKVSFKSTVNSLAADGWITSAQAAHLRSLVDSL